MHKRWLVASLVVVLVLGSVGLLTASAQDDEAARPYLGVRIVDTDDGVQVTFVEPGSPADDAGLRFGDVIAAVDDTDVESAEQLVDLIAGYAPGDEIVLVVVWRGDERDVDVTLGKFPTEPERLTMPPSTQPRFEGTLNLFGLTASVTDDGLRIDEIDPDSMLADSGLQAGDVITAINGEKLEMGRGNAIRILPALRLDEPVTFTVLRDGEEVEVEVQLDLPRVELGLEPGFMSGLHPTQLGVSFSTITPELAADEELPVEEGALVREVFDDTPAAEAGLMAGDVITAVADDVLDQERTLADRLVAYEEGDVVTLTVLRDGDEIELEVTLGPRFMQMTIHDSMMPFHMQQGQRGGMFFFGPDGMMPFHMQQGQRGGMFFFGPDNLDQFFQGMPGFDFEFGPAPDAPAEPEAPSAEATSA